MAKKSVDTSGGGGGGWQRHGMSILGPRALAGWGASADYAGASVRFHGGGTVGRAGKMPDATGRSYPPPPRLRKPQEGQESDGQTESWCLDKAVLAQGRGPQ